MDKIILSKFLKAGFIYKERFNPTSMGTCQGGVISPCLALIALSGLESRLKSSRSRQRDKEKINLISYADDFIVTADNEELLQNKVIPTVKKFLAEIGLEMSPEKTKITHIEDGFNFLGFYIRKYKNKKLLIKPVKDNVKQFLQEIKGVIKDNYALDTEKLIYLLNEKIAGWTNYYKCVVSSKTFSYIDTQVFKALYSWALHRHPNKGKLWINKKYYTRYGRNNWKFFAKIKDKTGNLVPIYLRSAANTKIKRHVKVLSNATPFNPKFNKYFELRDKKGNMPDLIISSLGGTMLP